MSTTSENKPIKILKSSKRVKLYQILPRENLNLMKYSGGSEYIRNFGVNDSGEEVKCGDYSSFYSCECHKTIKIYQKTCNILECPECVYSVAERSGVRAAERMIGLKKYFKLKRIRHISFNIMHDNKKNYQNYQKTDWLLPNDKFEYDMQRKKIIKILRLFNASGVLIYHPYRINDKDEDNKFLYISGHFHFVGTVFLPENREFIEKFGFGYSAISEVYTKKDIAGIISYELTHCGYFASSLFWFGNFSYNNGLIATKEKIKEDVYCEYCDSPVFRCESEILPFLENHKTYHKLLDSSLIDMLMTNYNLVRVSYNYKFYPRDKSP